MAPPDFLRKLGARPGDVLLVLDPDLRPFAAGARVVREPRKGEKVRGVLFRPGPKERIPRDLRRYRARIQEDGFLWAVIPKKSAIEAPGRDVRFEDVLASALRTDLVDNKTLTFSETEYGVRLVVRRRLRRQPAGRASP